MLEEDELEGVWEMVRGAGTDEEAALKALLIAEFIDSLDADEEPEEVRRRRRNAAINGFSDGVVAGMAPSDALRADIAEWVEMRKSMKEVVQGVIARIEQEGGQ